MHRFVIRLLGGLSIAVGLVWLVVVPSLLSVPAGAGLSQATNPGLWIGLVVGAFWVWPQTARDRRDANARFSWPVDLPESSDQRRRSIVCLAIVGIALSVAASGGGSVSALLLLAAFVVLLYGVAWWLRQTHRLPNIAPPLWTQGLVNGPLWTSLALLAVVAWQNAVFDFLPALLAIVAAAPLFALLGLVTEWGSDRWFAAEPEPPVDRQQPLSAGPGA